MLDDIDLTDLDRFVAAVPHDWFDRLRREAPIYWNPEPEGDGFWVVTRHADVVSFNRDWRRFTSTQGISPKGHGAELSDEGLVMITMDPPQQTRFRGLISDSFKPGAIARLEEPVRRAFSPLLEAYLAAGGGDFVNELAGPFPVSVICDLMGVPQELGPEVYRWSNAMIPSQDPEYWVSPEHCAQALANFMGFADELIESKRRQPADDLTTLLVRSEIDGRPLSQSELRSFVQVLVVGGGETTRHLITHNVHELLADEEQRRRLVAGEVGVESAVEEMLRFACPVMQAGRWATEDVEAHGEKIRRGDRVTLWMTSANRDPEVFRDPHRLDVGRTPNWHAGLGAGGPHYCLGSHLARLEARVALQALLPHLDRLSVAAPAARLRSNFFHGIKHLELAVAG